MSASSLFNMPLPRNFGTPEPRNLLLAFRFQNSLYGQRHSFPLRRLLAQLALALLRQAVKLRLPVVFRRALLGFNPPRRLEALQCRIERALVDAQHILGNLLDALRNAPAMLRAERERLQDQQVERALQ